MKLYLLPFYSSASLQQLPRSTSPTVFQASVTGIAYVTSTVLHRSAYSSQTIKNSGGKQNPTLVCTYS
jgi:hypothetical protein